MLISGDRAYIASPVYPGESVRLHIVDLAAGAIVKSLAVDRLGEPFAYAEGIVYFGGNAPIAWDVAGERSIWRADLRDVTAGCWRSPMRSWTRVGDGFTSASSMTPSCCPPPTAPSSLGRRTAGHTKPTNIMATYGAYRLRLTRDLLIVAAGDRGFSPSRPRPCSPPRPSLDSLMAHDEHPPPRGTGQVGTILARAFHADHHEVVVLSRTPQRAPWRVVAWTPSVSGRGPASSTAPTSSSTWPGAA